MRAVVQMSGGVGSWGAARRTVERYGRDAVTLLFADTMIEDPDLYRFLDDAAGDLEVPITRIADGRTPWEVFRDEKMMGNSQRDPCSRILKRELLRAWIEGHCDPDDTVVVLGIDWTEIHRFERAVPRWEPWRLEAPLCQQPYVDKVTLLEQLAERGIDPPGLYADGFPHNNCGGFCVKAGIAQFAHLYRKRPQTYALHEAEEEAFRDRIGKDVSIMRDRNTVRGHTKPLTMRTLRLRIEAQGTLFADDDDWGGCGCAIE